MMSETKHPGTFKFDDILSGAGNDCLGNVQDLTHNIKIDAPGNIQFTSGTTGRPKAVTLSHHNIVNNAFQIGHRIGYDEKVKDNFQEITLIFSYFSPTVSASRSLSTTVLAM